MVTTVQLMRPGPNESCAVGNSTHHHMTCKRFVLRLDHLLTSFPGSLLHKEESGNETMCYYLCSTYSLIPKLPLALSPVLSLQVSPLPSLFLLF